jgi:hypothetical protein
LMSRRGRVGWMVAEYEGEPTEGGWTQHN